MKKRTPRQEAHFQASYTLLKLLSEHYGETYGHPEIMSPKITMEIARDLFTSLCIVNKTRREGRETPFSYEIEPDRTAHHEAAQKWLVSISNDYKKTGSDPEKMDTQTLQVKSEFLFISLYIYINGKYPALIGKNYPTTLIQNMRPENDYKRIA